MIGIETDLPSLRSFGFGDYAFNNAPYVVVTSKLL